MINGVLKPPQIKLSWWEAGVNYWGSVRTKGIFFICWHKISSHLCDMVTVVQLLGAVYTRIHVLSKDWGIILNTRKGTSSVSLETQ